MKKKITALLLILGMTIASFDAGAALKADPLDEALESTEGESTVEALENTGRVVASTYAYGTELTHDSRFDNYEKIYGIDVSKWQETIDWEKVRNAGIEFAILRIGNRTWGDGTISKDIFFDEYMKGAHEAGIDLGVYFYTQAVNEREAKAEAEFVIENLKKYPGYLTYPVYFDIEDIDKHRLGAAKLSNAQTTALCKTFCDTILKAGYDAGVYANYTEFNSRMNKSELAGYNNWLARFAKAPTLSGTATGKYFDGAYNMWQYSSSGKVSGINGNVDMDVFYKSRMPGKTSGLKQTGSSASAIKLSWKQAEYADGYQIVCMDEDGDKIKTVKTSVPEYRLTQLTNGETWKFKVRAYNINSDGSYNYGKYSSVCDGYTLPEKVENVEQTDYDRTSVTIEWEPVLGAVGYRIRAYDATKKTYTTLGTTITNSYEITGLNLPETKEIAVDAYVTLNGSTKKYGKASERCTVETGLEPVEDVTHTTLTTDAITLSWKKLEDISGYEVNCYDKDGQFLSKEDVEGETYTKEKLEAATEYQFDVRSYLERTDGSRVYSEYSDRYCITTMLKKVEGVKAQKQDAASITLTWDEVEGASGYQVYSYNTDTGKSKLLATINSNTYEITRLTANTVYQYKVAAYLEFADENYCGDASEIFETITKPAKITGMKVTSVNKNSVTFTWSAQENISGYRVYLYDKNTKKSKFIKATAKNSYTLKELNSSTNYYVKVKAYHKWNNSTYYGTSSALLTAKTK